MKLPEIITRYVDAANRFDVAAAAACFTADARVRDENYDHAGRAAVRNWIDETSQNTNLK